jgi:hypothetical protein
MGEGKGREGEGREVMEGREKGRAAMRMRSYSCSGRLRNSRES